MATKLSIRLGEKADDISYKGELRTSDFDLGTLLAIDDLNGFSVNAEVKGHGVSIKSLNADFKGKILNVMYNGYNYKDITLNGEISEKLFKGELVSKDPNADFDFNGTVDFKNKVPEMDFISTINNLKLNALKLISNKDSGNISSQVFIKIKGNSLDNLSGQINFDNTIYKTRSRTFKLSSFNIDMDQENEEKKIKLTTAYLNAGIKGRYQLSNLKPAFQHFLFNYYPTFFKKPVKYRKFTDDLTFRIKIKKFNTINELFLPDLMLSPETTIEGNFNTIDNKLNIQASTSKINYKTFSVKDLGLILNENDNTVLGEISGKTLNVGDSTLLENFNFSVKSIDKDSKFSLDWDNLKSPANKGEIAGDLSFDNASVFLAVNKLTAVVRDSSWKLTQPNTASIDKDGNIDIKPIEVLNNNQKISVAGILSTRPGDSLTIKTSDVVLAQFNPLLKLVKLNLEGVLNGTSSCRMPVKILHSGAILISGN